MAQVERDDSAMGCGVPAKAIHRYIEEQIFTLPGVDRPQEKFSVLLTGSRGTAAHGPYSDVDIDVVCPRAVFDSVQRASLAAGRIMSLNQSFYLLPEDEWQRYYGHKIGRPHFSLAPLEEATRDLQEYRDVPIWIWTNAKIIHDPHDQFRRVLEGFKGYPRHVLVRKIKYRWMLVGYWDVEVFPYNHSRHEEILPGATSLLNSVNELLRLFFLVEGKPFAYTEKLIHFASSTKLGKEFVPFLTRVVDLVLGREWQERNAWDRLDEAHRLLCYSDKSADCRRLEKACADAMLAAGVEAEWVAADYSTNIGELLSGKLGPVP